MSVRLMLKRLLTRAYSIESKPTVHSVSMNSFNANHSLYDDVRPSYDQPFVDLFLRDLNLTNSQDQFDNKKPILELAAGTGKFTLNLVNAGWTDNLTVVEPSHGMLETFREKMSVVTHCFEGDSYNIPAPNNSYDAILIAQGFHWFANLDSLKEMHRVLKPGGKLGLIWNFDTASRAHIIPEGSSHDVKFYFKDESFKSIVEDYLLKEVITKEIERGSLTPEKRVRRLIELLGAQTRWDMLSRYIYQYSEDLPQYFTGEWRKLFHNQSFFRVPSVIESFEFKYSKIARDMVFPYWESRSYIYDKPPEVKEEIKKKVDEMVDSFDDYAFADDKKEDVMMFLGTHYFVIDVNK